MSLDLKVACWDLDHTLGFFEEIMREVYIELEEGRPAEPINPVQIRKGIGETLGNLSERGFVHYITSNNPIKYIEKAIQRAGLTHYFKGMFGVDEVKGLEEAGKHYRPVANRHNFSDEQARSCMIIIGDSSLDQPVDLSGVVFIQDMKAPYTSIGILEQLAYMLLDAGNENLNTGFKALCERTLNTPHKRSLVKDNIKYTFDYKTNPTKTGIVVPTITIDWDYGQHFKSLKEFTSRLETVNPNQTQI